MIEKNLKNRVKNLAKKTARGFVACRSGLVVEILRGACP